MATPTRSITAMICRLIACLSVLAFLSSGAVFAAAVDTKKSESYFEDAKKYLKKKDVNAAIIQLKNALKSNPGNVAARTLLGEIYLRIGNGASAEKEFKFAIRQGESVVWGRETGSRRRGEPQSA